MPPPVTYPGLNMQDSIREAARLHLLGVVGLGIFINNVRSGGKWDFKKDGRQYEPFGNYHFGVVAAVMFYGLPEETAHRGAGTVQMLVDHRRGVPPTGHGCPLDIGPSYYGDQVQDRYWIDQGMQDFADGMYGRAPLYHASHPWRWSTRFLPLSGTPLP